MDHFTWLMRLRSTATSLATLAVASFVTVLPLFPAHAQTQSAPRSSQGGQITTAILISAASTQAAVERANAQTRSLYVELNRERTARRAALRRVGISERERARLESELDAVNARQDELLAQLAAQDVEYAANIRAFRQGLTGLLEDGDSRIVAALQRYADGDAAALDDLQEITRVMRNAREAGLRARSGADQRSIASIWFNARDRGERTARQALNAWLEAAEVDPDDFWQWSVINDLAREVGDNALEIEATNQLWSRAESLDERISASEACTYLHIANGRWCRQDWTREQYQTEEMRLSRERVASKPDDPLARYQLAVTILRIAQLLPRDQGNRPQLLAEALGLLTELERQYPNSPVIAQRAVDAALEAGALSLVFGDERNRTRQLLEVNVALAWTQVARSPDSFAANSALVRALQTQSGVADADRNEQESLSLTTEAVTLAETAYRADRDSSLRGASLWHALTRAAMSARVYGAFGRERDYYGRALTLGRHFADGDSRYMVELTLPRLMEAELLLGNLDAARALANEVEANSVDASHSAANILSRELAEAALLHSRIAWIGQDYATAEGGFRRVLMSVADSRTALSEADQVSFYLAASFQLIVMFVEQQRYDGAIAIADAARAGFAVMAQNEEMTAPANFAAMAINTAVVWIPGSGMRWSDMQLPSTEGLDPDAYFVDASAAQQFADLATAQDEPFGTGTRQEQLIARLRTMSRVSHRYLDSSAPRETLLGGFLSVLKLRAHAGDPDVPWSHVADEYLNAHRLGWLTQPGNLSDMVFAVARSTFLSRPRESAQLP